VKGPGLRVPIGCYRHHPFSERPARLLLL